MIDSPDVRYGRVLESAEISGYTAQRAFEGVRGLLVSGDWQRVGSGFDDVSTFIRSVPFGMLNPPDDLRLEYERVAFEHGASKRAIADSAGVSHTTVQNDLNDGKKLPPEPAREVREGPDDGKKLPPEPDLTGELEDVPLWSDDLDGDEANEPSLEDPLPPEIVEEIERRNAQRETQRAEHDQVDREAERRRRLTVRFAESIAALSSLLDPSPDDFLYKTYEPSANPHAHTAAHTAFSVDGLRTIAAHIERLSDLVEARGGEL